MNIAQSIRALLDKEGKVVVPGLGIFEIKHFPARLDKDKKKISAPQTHLFFIQKLNATDDMLINYVAEQEKISKEESAKAVENYINALKDKLKLANKVKIERLGHLIIRDKHLYFKPDVVNDLPELQAEPVRKEPKAEVIVEEKEEKPASAFASYLAMPLILLFIIIMILLYLTINPFNTPLFKTKYSGHYPFSKYPVREIVIPESQSAVEETVAQKPPEQEEREQQTAQIQEEPEQQTPQIQEEPAESEPVITPPPKTGKYHIIVASLEYRTMAEVYAEKLIRNGYPEGKVIGPARNGN